MNHLFQALIQMIHHHKREGETFRPFIELNDDWVSAQSLWVTRHGGKG